jgi:hypothetical protein
MEDMQSKYDKFLDEMPANDCVTFVDQSSKIEMGWLHAISTNGKYRYLSDCQTSTALSIYTLTSQVSEGACTKCGEMDNVTHYEACPSTSKQLIWNRMPKHIKATDMESEAQLHQGQYGNQSAKTRTSKLVRSPISIKTAISVETFWSK